MISQFLLLISGAKCFWHKRVLRSSVNVFDHRVFPVRIKILGTPDCTIDIGLAVATLRNERLRRFPTGREQFMSVGLFQWTDDFAIIAAAQVNYRWRVHARPGVYKKSVVR